MLKNISIFILFIFSTNVFSCSCDSVGTITNKVFKENQLIALGKVIKVDTTDFQLIVNLKIDKSYYGKTDSIIQVYTNPGGAACGITAKPDEEWLIFAYLNNKKIETDLCTRSKNINNPISIVYDTKFLEKDLDFLNNYIKK